MTFLGMALRRRDRMWCNVTDTDVNGEILDPNFILLDYLLFNMAQIQGSYQFFIAL